MAKPDCTVEDRFWSKVNKNAPNGCWVWVACVQANGYGRFMGPDRKACYAHRFAYQLINGSVPSGLDLDHLCRNTRCVNPAHLEAVTHRENILRGNAFSAKHAAKTHCPHGHEYTPENTRMNRGQRHCRTCQRAWNARRYPKRSEDAA